MLRPRPEHWLLALIYSGPGMGFSSHMRYLGISPQDLLDALRRCGVNRPRHAPTPNWSWSDS